VKPPSLPAVKPLAFLFLLCLLPRTAFSVVIDRVVAVVNKEIITQTELEEAIRARRGDPQKVSERELLNQMVEKKLELQTARKKGVRIGDDELKLALNDIKQRNGFASDDALKQALGKEGLTWEKYLENLREELIVLKLVAREIDPNLLVTEEELKAFYETQKDQFTLPTRVRLGQIFLATGPNASPEEVEEVQRRVNDLETALKEGKDFAALAREFGEGPERRLGGDIGYFQAGDLSPAIEQVVFRLKEGETTGVIRSPAGFHIFKVEEKHSSEYRSFDASRKQIEEGVLAKKREELRRKWVSELWANAYVEIK